MFIRRNIRLRDFDYSSSSHAYFITICTYGKKAYFFNNKLRDFAQRSLECRQNNKEISIFCCCIMPDHIHLLISLNEDYNQTLSNWVSSFKRFISKTAKRDFNINDLWQRNYYDHIIRTEESMYKIAEYILENPVRKNIVQRSEEYPSAKLYF